jgi:hypothetical protein
MKCRIRVITMAPAVLLALTLAVPGLPTAGAEAPNRAGLVVRFGNGSFVTRCIEFGESEMSGYDALIRSGLDVVAAFDSGIGAAVCKIEDDGCPLEDCLTCDAPNYWSYWHLSNGAWNYSPAGGSSYKVQDGDVEGWSWGTGDPPPVVAFDQICAPPATDTPTLTDTPQPTNTPQPPTATPVVPTATSSPPEPMVWFRLDENPIPAGSCTTVRWDTDDALEVYLDGERVNAAGSQESCPTTSQEYHLRVVGEAGEKTHTLVLGVTGALPSVTATPQPVALLSASPSPSPTIQPVPATSPPPSPTPKPGGAISASPSPGTEPPTSVPPSSSPTPLRVALVATSTTPTRVTQPTAVPSHSSSAAEPVSSSPPPISTSLGYITFNFTMIGLLGWLSLRMLRRR